LSIPALRPPSTLDADPRPLVLSAKLLYGVGEMPITVLMVLSGLFILFFYHSVMGLPATLVGIGMSATLTLDAVTDPLIGHLSDRCRHRFGRRHIFMLPGALFMGPAFYMLFSPPRSVGHAGLFLWLLGSMLAVRASSAIYRIPYLGLGAEMSHDYDDRTSTMAVRAIFGLIGTLAAAGLSFVLFFPSTADGLEPKLNYDGYPHLGLAFGALMTVSGLISCFGTLGHRTVGPDKSLPAPPFAGAFRIAMQNIEYRRLWGSSSMFFMAAVLNASVAIHYFTWYARIPGGGTMGAFQTCLYLGALVGAFLWMALARRVEKRNLKIVALAATATLLFLAALLVRGTHSRSWSVAPSAACSPARSGYWDPPWLPTWRMPTNFAQDCAAKASTSAFPISARRSPAALRCCFLARCSPCSASYRTPAKPAPRRPPLTSVFFMARFRRR